MERTKRRRSPTVLSLLCIALAHFDGRSAFYYCSKDLERRGKEERGKHSHTAGSRRRGRVSHTRQEEKTNFVRQSQGLGLDREKGWQ